MAKKKEITFNSALEKLERSVKRLEEEEIDLEKFVDIFTEGVKCATICQKKLNEAQKRIDIVLKEFNDTTEELRTIDEKELFSED
jgi:exodeoxyribonuclease VII small subunit